MAIPLRRNIRFYVLLSTVALAAAVFMRTWYSTNDGLLLTTRLTQYFALLALTYLYVALLIGPAVYMFPKLPWRGYIYRSRRAVGFSAFLFAQVHAEIAFWLQLGGIKGLPYLPINYLIAITLSSIALIILTLMALTSFDRAVQYLGIKRWKILHRFVYLAALLALIHAVMLGTHFADLSALIPQIFLVAFGFLMLLETNRFDAYLARTLSWPKKIPIFLVLWIVSMLVFVFWRRPF